MKVYLVGGAVRDELLGRQPKDKDYVIVGATPDQMLALGYKQVGADFPVFLDDEGVEHALARTERKTGVGYNGFTVDANPNVTLEDDLRRRDLTINSMARDLDTGRLIDPFNGEEDLRKGVLRHTSEAFAEDPLRVLRVARFASRYSFIIASETLRLMESLTDEMSTLTTERVWMELEKAMMEADPRWFPTHLKVCGAWSKLFPEIHISPDILRWLDNAVAQKLTLNERIVTLFTGSHISNVDACFARFKVPAELSRLYHNVWKLRVSMADQFNWLTVLKSVDAYRRPNGMFEMCNVLRCLKNERLCVIADNVEAAYYATVAVDFDSLPAEIKSQGGPAVGKGIDNLRQEILDKLTFIPLPEETWVY